MTTPADPPACTHRRITQRCFECEPTERDAFGRDAFGMVADGDDWPERQAEADSAAWTAYQAECTRTVERARALGLTGD
ncbi:MAG TPA: hypothetical protein VJP45_08770, partial [Candidatus Limnocylindria bacterium]|nr:hypothetical protein [Candidatus Limnocylindria bacterium]